MLLQGDRFVQRPFRQTQVACKTAQYLIAEEIVGMIFDQPSIGLMLQPLCGRTIVFRTACGHAASRIHLIGEHRSGFVSRFREAFGWCRKFGKHLRHEFATCFQNHPRLIIFRMRRIVNQQYDGKVGKFLQCRRPDGFFDDFWLFHIRWDEYGDAFAVVVCEMVIEHGSRYAFMPDEAV